MKLLLFLLDDAMNFSPLNYSCSFAASILDDHHTARIFGAYVNPARVLSATVVDLMDHEDRNGTEHRHGLLA